MSGGFIKVSGAQRKINSTYTKVNGVWRKVTVVSDKVGGAWREGWKDAFPMPSFLSYPATITRGDTITWTTEDVAGANYEWQVAYNGGVWSASSFTSSITGTYVISTDTSLNSFQMRIRAVAPTTHDSQSSWKTGPLRSLTPQKMAAPTGLSYTTSVARGDTTTVYWNVNDTAATYEVHAVLGDGVGGTNDAIIFSNKVSATGQTSFNYAITTDTKWKTIYFYVLVKKSGYYDSDVTTGSSVTLIGQKLAMVANIYCPTPQWGQPVTISWDAVPNARLYQLYVNYGTGVDTRIYWDDSRSYNYQMPASVPSGGSGYVMFKVVATNADYRDSDMKSGASIKVADPPLKVSTWTSNNHASYSFGINAWESLSYYKDYIWQGKWGSTGNYMGLAFFDYSNMKSVLAGKTITKVEIYVYRVSRQHGYSSGQAINLFTHNYASRPAGEPAMWWVQGPFGSWTLGEGKWVTVSNAVAERIRDGQATGIGFYRSDGAGYMQIATNVQIQVTYR